MAAIGMLYPMVASAADGVFTLRACIDLALEKNQQQHISQLAVETAEAQLKQAFSTGPSSPSRAGTTSSMKASTLSFPRRPANI